MLEQLGRDMATFFEDIEFIGLQKGIEISICTFNCLRTGATFCANTVHDLETRLEFIREHHKPLVHKKK